MHPKKEALRANRSPDRDDLVWAAGFLEGEGHFGNNGSRSKSEVVQVAQTNLEPLERARDVFGGSITKYEPDEENRSTYWTWRTSGYRARGIMMTLYPLLSRAKQEQIRSALTYWTGQ